MSSESEVLDGGCYGLRKYNYLDDCNMRNRSNDYDVFKTDKNLCAYIYSSHNWLGSDVYHKLRSFAFFDIRRRKRAHRVYCRRAGAAGVVYALHIAGVFIML